MSESKSFLETMAGSSRPESFEQEKFVYVKDGRKKRNLIAAGIAVVVLLIAIFSAVYVLNRVTVPELKGKSLSEATDWAQKNKVTLYVKSIYSFEDEEDTILSQEIKAGKSIKKNSTLSIQTSLGADPEEAIAFPDIKSMTTTEIEKWISDNKLTGAKLVTANSDVVENNHVISYSFTDGTEENFKRKNRVTITVSIGSTAISETVVVTDFSSMKAGAVLQWGADNGIIIKLLEVFDNYITAGNIVAQSVKRNTEIKRTDSITVTISKGKPVTAPSFAVMSKDEANEWARANNVTLIIAEKYSDTIPKGKLLSQSISSGKSMKEGDEIKAYYSLGTVDIANYIGKTKLDIINWQNTANEKGANIKLSFTETFGEKGSAGKIISQSVKNDYVSTGSVIDVAVSKGMKIVTPAFEWKTETECNNIGKDTGLTVIFDYKYSESVGKGYVISQYPAKDTIITDADAVTVVISLAKTNSDVIVVPDFTSLKSSSILQWGEDNGIIIKVTEAYSSSIPSGYAISQSIPKNKTIKINENITVTVSKGAPPSSIIAANLASMTKDEANAWAKQNNVTLAITERYSDTYAKSILFGQSIAVGSSVYIGGTIQVYYSLGMVDVASFIGKTRLDIINWQNTVNEKGAAVNLTFTEAYGELGTAGKIIGQSVKNDYVSTGTTINFVISKGMRILVPNFEWKTKAESAAMCKDVGLSVLFDYQYSETMSKGFVLSQSFAKDTVVTDTDTITIVISLGPL